MLTNIVSLLHFPLLPVCIYPLLSTIFCYGLFQYLTEDDHIPQVGEKCALKLLVDFGFKVIKDLRYACMQKHCTNSWI